MRLTFCPLFSGSNGNALYAGCGDTRLLIDAGVSGTRVSAALLEAGVDPARLNGILVTHEHADHIAGVGILSRRYNLPVYATEGTWTAMAEKVGAIDARNKRVFSSDADFYVGEINVAPFPTPHDAAEPVGYSLRVGGCSLSVATDLGAVRESWLERISRSELVLLESNHDVAMLKAGRYPYELKRRILGAHGHLSNEEAGKAAAALAQRGVRAIILGHLSGENNFPELAYESVCASLYEAGLRPGTDVKLFVARRDCRGELFVIDDGLVTTAEKGGVALG